MSCRLNTSSRRPALLLPFSRGLLGLLGLLLLSAPACGEAAAATDCCTEAAALITQMDECCEVNFGLPTSEMSGCCKEGMRLTTEIRPDCCTEALALRAQMAECCVTGMRSATDVCCDESSGS